MPKKHEKLKKEHIKHEDVKNDGIDRSFGEPTISELNIPETIVQGTQFDAVIDQHEETDASPKALVTVFTGLSGYVMLVTCILAGMFFGFKYLHSKGDTVPSAMFQSPVVDAPHSQAERFAETEQANDYLPGIEKQPPLMPTPGDPMKVLRAQENSEVNSYGYIHDAAGNRTGVRIPVTRAIDILKDKLPVESVQSSITPRLPGSPALNPAEDKGR